MNERITEELVRNKFTQYGYYNDSNLIVDEQKSTIPQIDKLLLNASKKGSGKGFPEFIIKSKEINGFVCVVECKADITKHQSKTLNKYSDYAVDGAKLYADYLSKELDVLFIGVSGQNEKELKVSHYFQLKGESEIQPAFDNEILDFNSYIETYKQVRFRVDYQELFKYVRTLNEKLHQRKIPEDKRAILFSGILIALEDGIFLESYKNYTNAQRLGDFLVKSIVEKLKNSNINEVRAFEMEQAFNFIKAHTSLIDEGYLIELVAEIHNNIRTFVKNNEYCDIISKAYVEFLKYANNDSGLGIVLTPSHITNLFCDIAKITKDSVVFDNCCGTGGFLVVAMEKMIQLAKGDLPKIDNIKKQQLVGIEYQDHIFTLCCSNMILHGDGKTNIIKGDCFKQINEAKKYKPTIGLLNPPYNDSTGLNELEFVLNNLEAIEKNGVCIAIMPTRCALYQKGAGMELKKKILEKHTLEAVLSMPEDLFYPVGTVTCVMVIKAHIPHEEGYKTYFGNWKDDGFEKRKHQGRVETARWLTIKKKWLNSIKNREVEAGFSIIKEITAEDEWCAEAYLETDYSKLTEEDFVKNIKNYTGFLFANEKIENATNQSVLNNTPQLNPTNWKLFQCGGKDGIFDITLGKPVHKNEVEDGNLPYITRTALNNGVEMFGSSQHINEGNAITIGAEGIKAFYQECSFITGNKINIIRHKHLNKYTAMFLCAVLNHTNIGRYNYGYAIVNHRLKTLQIKLPQIPQGKPDWEFMESYIKSLPYSSSL
jgi:type I restriction enzyme M protein